MEPGRLVKVTGARNGWLDVEPAGGVPVWVFGRYANVADGVATITGSRVRVRALPGTGSNAVVLGPVSTGTAARVPE